MRGSAAAPNDGIIKGVMERPSDLWRNRVVEEAAMVAKGELDPEDAYASELWSEALIAGTGAVLASFEHSLGSLDPASDGDVSAAIEAVVLALNDVNSSNRSDGRTGYETGEREQLCD